MRHIPGQRQIGAPDAWPDVIDPWVSAMGDFLNIDVKRLVLFADIAE